MDRAAATGTTMFQLSDICRSHARAREKINAPELVGTGAINYERLETLTPPTYYMASKLIAYDEWLKNIVGISRTAGWYYRKRGWITPLNLSGRLFLTEEEVERFDQRLKAGEFAGGRNSKKEAIEAAVR
jgi:hypothetical protein